jgi:hypothetical protein
MGDETEITATQRGLWIADDETATNNGCLATGERSDKYCNYT